MEGTKSTLSLGTEIILSDERSAILTRSVRVRLIEGPIVSLPQEIFLTLLAHADTKTLIHFCETKREFHNLCQDEVLWKNRTKGDYGVVVLPERFRSWQDYYMHLTKPREIPVMMYNSVGAGALKLSGKHSSARISYRTDPRDLVPTLLSLYDAIIPSKTSEKLAIFAMTAEYPYRLTQSDFVKDEKGFMSKELWRRIYIVGIEHISIFPRRFIRIRGFVTFRLEGKYIEIPYYDVTTVNNIILFIYFYVKESHPEWPKYGKFDTTISIPTLEITANYSIYGSILDGTTHISIVDFLAGEGKPRMNEQGFYPLISADVKVKFIPAG